MSNKQLNPFEIKAELLSVMAKLKGVQNLDEYSLHYKLLDSQEDKNIIIKLLFKELANVKDNAPIIKFLLIRYCEHNILIEKLWALIKNPMSTNLSKIIALDILRDISTDWSYENCEGYLDNPEEFIDEDTRRLLTAAIINPEVQIDFLDFLNSLNNNDKLTLISSLANDYEKDELANVLIPVFLSEPESEVGKKALELLGNSKSQLAYHALLNAKDFVSESVLPKLKKGLSTLKLSGIREDNSHEFYQKLLGDSKPYRLYSTYPDGMGNQALIFSRLKKGGKVQFVAIVINDYYGIKDCFGFNEISKFECDTIIERFYKQEKAIETSPEIMKFLLEKAEQISKKSGKWKIPYEYICWKNILADIDSQNINMLETLETKLTKKNTSPNVLKDVLELDFVDYWFLTPDYSDEYELFIQTLNTKLSNNINFDIDKLIDDELDEVFYPEERNVWLERIVLCAFLLLIEDKPSAAKDVYDIYNNPKLYNELLKLILKRSIYEYYIGLKHSDKGIFAKEVLDDIIVNIERKWVNSDV